MPAKSRRRRKFNLRRVRVTPTLTLSTLGAATVLTGGMTAASSGPYRVISAICSWTQSTLTDGEGPITVGYAHNDYSVGEIKEALEASAALDLGDKVAQEKANRLVRVVGTFRSEPNNDLNDGRPIKTKLNWRMNVGDILNIFAYNESTGALATGTFIRSTGNLWIRDV